MARTVVLDGTLDAFRAHARALIGEGIPPESIRWRDPLRSPRTEGAEPGLFGASDAPSPLPDQGSGDRIPALGLPRAYVDALPTISCYRDEAVWHALYVVAWRIARGDRGLMADPLDADVAVLQRMGKAVRRDAHKMHAFVRFRRIEDASARGGERFIAWYRPSHLIVEREASFFRGRFPSMDWSILTPDRCAHWNGQEVSFTEGAPRDAAPDHDELEELWCTYYASIFNPARVKISAMVAEMPRKFWDTLPETKQIPELLADVPRRLEEMAQSSRAVADSAAPFVPFGAPLDELRETLPTCEGCELHRDGTRAVAGEGLQDARTVLLGEQPGDTEEREGRPFVGPAGQVLDAALEAAGLRREDLYLTNAVKHFRHEPAPRGKRRLHKRPTIEHVTRCQPWLDAEMATVAPHALVCLGATAARAVFGPTYRMPDPGAPPETRTSRYANATLVTFHPSAILRAEDPTRAAAMRAHMERTLRATLADAAEGTTRPSSG